MMLKQDLQITSQIREFVIIYLGLQQKTANSHKIGKRIQEYHW